MRANATRSSSTAGPRHMRLEVSFAIRHSHPEVPVMGSWNLVRVAPPCVLSGALATLSLSAAYALPMSRGPDRPEARPTPTLSVIAVPAVRSHPNPARSRARVGIVSGLVTDSATHAPLAEVTVQVEGTTLATGTSVDGRYRIVGIPAGTVVVRVRRIGYASVTRRITIVDGQSITADFALTASAVELGGVVVTGTAGETERIQQPAVVGTIDAASVVRAAPISDVTQLLQGRIPGLVVSPSSGTAGTAARINLRGAASVSLSNQPLVFIDGVRVEARPRDLIVAYSSEGVGGQTVHQAVEPVQDRERPLGAAGVAQHDTGGGGRALHQLGTGHLLQELANHPKGKLALQQPRP